MLRRQNLYRKGQVEMVVFVSRPNWHRNYRKLLQNTINISTVSKSLQRICNRSEILIIWSVNIIEVHPLYVIFWFSCFSWPILFSQTPIECECPSTLCHIIYYLYNITKPDLWWRILIAGSSVLKLKSLPSLSERIIKVVLQIDACNEFFLWYISAINC